MSRPIQTNNIPAGIVLMLAATAVFAMQDGISRHLADSYNTMIVVMVRYWFFAAFVITLATRAPGGIRGTAATSQPFLQVFRGLLLACEVCVAVYGFTILGLIESHAIFICFPLLIAALSGPILGEGVGWRRWTAVGIGFIGVLVILQPGMGVFSPAATIPLLSAFLFALYSLLTRFAARRDNVATSFFWTGVAGSVLMTVVGLPFWEPMAAHDWGWMCLLCLTGALGHWLLIKCYEMAEASAVQPFAYFHMFWGAILGILLFDETIRLNVAFGAGLILVAGIFTLLRERRKG